LLKITTFRGRMLILGLSQKQHPFAAMLHKNSRSLTSSGHSEVSTSPGGG